MRVQIPSGPINSQVKKGIKNVGHSTLSEFNFFQDRAKRIGIVIVFAAFFASPEHILINKAPIPLAFTL